MTVVAVGLLGVEVVGADDGGVGDHLTACSHTQVTHVVRHRAAHATHQPAYSSESERDKALSSQLIRMMRFPTVIKNCTVDS